MALCQGITRLHLHPLSVRTPKAPSACLLVFPSDFSETPSLAPWPPALPPLQPVPGTAAHMAVASPCPSQRSLPRPAVVLDLGWTSEPSHEGIEAGWSRAIGGTQDPNSRTGDPRHSQGRDPETQDEAPEARGRPASTCLPPRPAAASVQCRPPPASQLTPPPLLDCPRPRPRPAPPSCVEGQSSATTCLGSPRRQRLHTQAGRAPRPGGP